MAILWIASLAVLAAGSLETTRPVEFLDVRSLIESASTAVVAELSEVADDGASGTVTLTLRVNEVVVGDVSNLATLRCRSRQGWFQSGGLRIGRSQMYFLAMASLRRTDVKPGNVPHVEGALGDSSDIVKYHALMYLREASGMLTGAPTMEAFLETPQLYIEEWQASRQ